jgi:hypothetical protein
MCARKRTELLHSHILGGNMRRRSAAVVALLLAVMCQSAAAQTAVNLNTPYAMKAGDYSALLLSEFLKINTALDMPIIVTYEPTENTIDVEVFGGWATVESARKTVNQVLEFVRTAFVPYAQRRMNVSPTDKNFRIMYYDRTQRTGPKLIVTWDRGQLIVPPSE